ncbi:MAG TPA: hypothetical protein VE082_06845 [Desulfobaccales bacterium]|nr:hypothetical protein [Desulfobaccales bacterium]
MKTWGKTALLVPLLVLVLATGVWGTMSKAEMIDGNQWTTWSYGDQLVYIRGISNWADFVSAARAAQPDPDKTWGFSMSKCLADALKAKSLGRVVGDVNAYYQANPGNINASVVEVILKHSVKICPP